MTSRIGQRLLRRALQLVGTEPISSATSSSVSNYVVTIPRIYAPAAPFEPSLPRTTIRTLHLSHIRYLCSAPKDLNPSSSSISVQDNGPDNVLTTPEDERDHQKPSPRHDLAMLFTCTVCDTRSAKTMSRVTYETGIVIVRCPNCRNLHLIADRLGWFGEPGSVEDFLRHQGVSVRKGNESSYEFSVHDLTGWTPPNQSKG